ncbi:MAG: dienelactone hydrolase family protein [Streptosporangiaceae bacterium]
MGDVTISTSAGGMPGYLSSPDGGGRWPGVVVLHDGFGIDAAVREQADWLAGAGYLALSVDLGFWGRPSACLLRMFRDLRAGRGQTFGQVDAARAWLAGQPECDGRLGVIGFCATGGFALLTAAGHGFCVSSINYGLVRKNAADALRGACPIVASFGARDRSLRKAPQRLGRALEALGIDHDIKVYPDAGHAFLHQSQDESGPVAGVLARITHAGYHEASAQDARRRIVAFFDAHLKT